MGTMFFPNMKQGNHGIISLVVERNANHDSTDGDAVFV
jgi:hypothetical protein